MRVDWLDGKPVALTGAVSGTITTAHGPWRAEGDWWQPAAWAVEIWQVELAEGSVYQLARQNGGWSVEGVLD